MKNIMVASKRRDVAAAIRDGLAAGERLTVVRDSATAVGQMREQFFDIVFLDLEDASGRVGQVDFDAASERLAAITTAQPGAEVVVMAPVDQVRAAVKLVKAGAGNYLTYPIDPEEVRLIIDEIGDEVMIQSELKHLRDKSWARLDSDSVDTRCENMATVLEQIRSVASTRSTVLIYGETGTGKTRLAKLLHQSSHRKESPFISVHCGAIPDTLLESELFGHEKGAFTGAIRMKRGKFEVAQGGTLFLDEIGTITAAAQIKLLTVIQEGEFSRVGGELPLRIDVRLVAATNQNLKELVDAGGFRKDLYYRLNVFPVCVPPLRDRRADIPLLVDTFIEQFNLMNNKHIQGVDAVALNALQQYEWPGNIRELQNVIERAHILESGSIIMPESLPLEIVREMPTAAVPIDTGATLAEVRKQAVEQTERQYIKALLARNGGRINASADEAGITPRQLNKLLHKYDIKKEAFKTSSSRRPA